MHDGIRIFAITIGTLTSAGFLRLLIEQIRLKRWTNAVRDTAASLATAQLAVQQVVFWHQPIQWVITPISICWALMLSYAIVWKSRKSSKEDLLES